MGRRDGRKIGAFLPGTGQVVSQRDPGRRGIMSGYQIKAGTDQAQLAGFIPGMAVQIVRMQQKGKLAQNQAGCQENGCDPVIHCFGCCLM